MPISIYSHILASNSYGTIALQDLKGNCKAMSGLHQFYLIILLIIFILASPTNSLAQLNPQVKSPIDPISASVSSRKVLPSIAPAEASLKTTEPTPTAIPSATPSISSAQPKKLSPSSTPKTISTKASATPQILISTTPSPAKASPTLQKPKESITKLYRSKWTQRSLKVLEENGIPLPSTINYDQLIERPQFDLILARVAKVNKQVFKSKINRHIKESITRGTAIDSVIRAFGFQQKMENFKDTPSKFKDLPQHHPAYLAIVMAEKTKLINGYPDQTIRPDELLSWGEALILIETVHNWRKALPTTAPEWVKSYENQQEMGFKLVDLFRLLLTMGYGIVALIFLLRVFKKSRKKKDQIYRPMSILLIVTTLMLLALWLNDILYTYGLMKREFYEVIALISVFVSLLLLKTGVFLEDKMTEPSPQAVIDVGYVDAINQEKGELFIIDVVSGKRALGLMQSGSKVYSQNKNEGAFLSDIQVGDHIKVTGSGQFDGALVDIESIQLLAQQPQNQELNQKRKTLLQQMQENQYKQSLNQENANQKFQQLFRQSPPESNQT